MLSKQSPLRSFFLAVCAVAAGGLGGCKPEPEAAGRQQPAAPVAVQVAPAALLPTQRSVEITGTLFGDEEVTVAAKVSGRIQQTGVEIGDRVPRGAELGQIEATDYKLAVAQAEAALAQTLSGLGLKDLPDEKFDIAAVPTVKQASLQAANAQARLARAEKLFRQQPPLISEQDFADAQTAAAVGQSAAEVAALAARTTLAEVQARQVDLAVKRQLLADTVLRSPASAAKQPDSRQYAVSARLVTAGDYVREGTPAFRLIIDNPIRFRASVPERFLSDIAVGQKVSIMVEGRDDAFPGILKRINPQVDLASRSFQVEIVAENDKGLLRPGAFARGSVATHIDKQALFVPQSAVQTFAGIRKVYTLDAGKVVEHEVLLGTASNDMVEITSGLKAGADVIVKGPARLASGMNAVAKPAATTSPR